MTILAAGLGGCVQETISAPPETEQAPPAAPAPAPVASLPPVAPAPPPAAVPKSPLADDLSGKVDVALLLPLSGPDAGLGQDMLDAATLAVFEYGNDRLAVTPKDTKGTAAGAADAARATLADGAQLIIGPLTGSEVEAVRPVTQPANINVVAFSNQAQIAGGNVFLLGFLPGQEAQRMADYAHSTGITRFAVLAPSNRYGQLVAEAFQDEVMHDGGTIDQIQYYDAAGGDPSQAIKGLATNGQVGFDALLIPEPGPQQLKNLASMLPTADIDPPKVRLLGTDTWDVPSIGSEPTLVGGWFAAPPPGARAAFEERFRAAYGRRPRRLATLAYDAVAMAAVLQRTPGGSFSADALCNPSGFAGADGIFRLRADGTTERGLAILQVERDHASVVSPAPESFTAGSP